MIQLDEKLPEPPAYSHTDSQRVPPVQSPAATGANYAGASHGGPGYGGPNYGGPGYTLSSPAQTPMGYPPGPANGMPMNQQQPPPRPQLTPAQLEAQAGSQYQQQLFARCARGDHDVVKKYGPCGIITAVLLFPIGLICLFADVERKCSRCGVMLH